MPKKRIFPSSPSTRSRFPSLDSPHPRQAKKIPSPSSPLFERSTIGLDESLFRRLAREYRRAWGIPLLAVEPEGRIRFGRPPCRGSDSIECCEVRAFAIAEALRWGEPTLTACPRHRLLWAAPIMWNEKVIGALVAHASEPQIFAGEGDRPPLDTRRACETLRLLLEAENLTNATLLRIRREEYQREQERAYAIHDFKTHEHQSVRELYLREEPALFSAIRSGDFGVAREILNRILVAIHYYAGSRLDVMKSFFLELVVSMSHTAVEAGAKPEDLWGTNFTRMVELAAIHTEEDLAAWLRKVLEELLEAIRRNRRRDTAVQLHDAIAYMERHFSEPITREDVAKIASLSPSYFSTLLHQESGATFRELLNRIRIDRAAELLTQTDRPLVQIALDCGFQDQSYFTKIFKRFRKLSPLQYRKRNRAG